MSWLLLRLVTDIYTRFYSACQTSAYSRCRNVYVLVNFGTHIYIPGECHRYIDIAVVNVEACSTSCWKQHARD